MSHETMLAWLDKANSGAIQGASDRLVSAATEIRKIAEDLKVRPQMVEWKGEGADAFRTWSADLANATLRLGDYSEGASKWLAQASDALASAQVAIPRTDASAEANLKAAQAARNDPDASAVQKKSLETLLAAKESNRQEAAAQMRRLAQSYSFSASQMDGLEKPVFPPPPGAIVPERVSDRDSAGQDYVRDGAASGGVGSGATAYASTVPVTGGPDATRVQDTPVLRAPAQSAPVDMSIDSVATLPPSPSVPAGAPPAPPVTGRVDAGPSLISPSMPPVLGGGSKGVPGPAGKFTGTGVRPPTLPGQSGLTAGTAGRMPRDGGITGGRPVAQTAGRPPGGLPRGTVVGAEGTHAGRGGMGHGGAGLGGAGGGNQSGIVGGRRLSGETGGMVGGRPQQPGRSGGRPFTPGGTGLVRSSGSSEGARGAGPVGRGAAPQRSGEARRDEGERPDYLVEDEETWQQGRRRIVPPVID
ncbi:WXG100 family type VII secretion target [Streptomyces sp. NPDC005494]|uniref:WXG100 family type VII secretion target n=1 Tax=Streptomyces sp. NPDC005494 TaxID=3364715 RepID=UPI0036C21B0C